MHILTESEILERARRIGMEEQLIDYAFTIQKQLSAEGDSADWHDCLEMAYYELILND